MPVNVWSLEWLNQNSQRAYPMVQAASRTDISESFTIPNDFLVNLDMPVRYGLDVVTSRFFIKHIGAYGNGYLITVGYQPTSGDAVDVATAIINKANHAVNTPYALGGVGDFADTVGKLVIGDIDDIDKQPAGFYTFALDDTNLEVDCIRPFIRGVSSVSLINGASKSDPLYGDIEFEAGRDIQLVPITASGENPKIRINVVSGAGVDESCVCDDSDISAEPITKINGVGPAPNGNFTLLAGDCLSFEQVENGLRIVNTCSKPCCGCAELERITQDLQRVQQEAATIRDFATKLSTQAELINTTILGSRTGGNCGS